ncbi:hypothetical protein [Aeromicrobium duanguangcaii]|uniref:hypothetical protein n=1 Tax=Aeromicrobium duanguangcaii TaxID=2968086 RepID=UPI0020180A78|nr:hypothetical protein [Aeromicrobium duanguangcaii]MCL3839198.1 hypothetical protein [Aeromicrobium duanguangcaii]
MALVIGFTVVQSSGSDDADEAEPTASPSTASQSVGETPEESATGDAPQKKTRTPAPAKTSASIPPEADPVPLDERVRTRDDVQIAIVKREIVKGKARFSGEISGPALRLTIEIRNGAKTPLDLGYVTVNAYTGKQRTPASPIAAPGGRPMEGTLKPGASADGVYLFSVGKSGRGSVTVGVDYRASEPTIIFRGSAS